MVLKLSLTKIFFTICFMNFITYELKKIIFFILFYFYIILKFYIFIWKLMSMIMILGFSLLSLIWTYILIKMYNF